MVLHLNLAPELERSLAARAAEAGLDIETFALRAVESAAKDQSLDEVLDPLRSEIAETWDEAELGDLLEREKHALRNERRGSR